MSRIGADGGDVQTLTDRTPPRAIAAIDGQHHLPDRQGLSYTVRDDRITSFDDAKTPALSFESGEARVVIEGGTHVRFVPSGHILHARGNGGLRACIRGVD